MAPRSKPPVEGMSRREWIARLITDHAETGGISFNAIANELGGNRTQVHDMIKLMVATGKVQRVGEGSSSRLLPV
jgi:DNA-binding IclR family transcriptional regulator